MLFSKHTLSSTESAEHFYEEKKRWLENNKENSVGQMREVTILHHLQSLAEDDYLTSQKAVSCG